MISITEFYYEQPIRTLAQALDDGEFYAKHSRDNYSKSATESVATKEMKKAIEEAATKKRKRKLKFADGEIGLTDIAMEQKAIRCDGKTPRRSFGLALY